MYRNKIFLIWLLVAGGLFGQLGCLKKKEYKLSVNVSAETAWSLSICFCRFSWVDDCVIFPCAGNLAA